MNNEKLLEYQMNFSKRHLSLFVILLLYTANSLIIGDNTGNTKYITIMVICIVLIVDMLLAYKKFFHKIAILRVVRCIEVFVSSLLISDYGKNNIGGIADCFAMLFYVLFVCETIFSIDVSDNGKRVRLAILCQLGLAISTITAPLFYEEDVISHLFNYSFLAVVSGLSTYAFASFYGNMQNYYFRYAMSKERLLDKAKDNSDKFNEIQNSVMLANEQLGIKKFEIEEAYRKINVANADIRIQNEFLNILVSTFDLKVLIEKTTKLFSDHFGLSFCGLIFKDRSLRKKYSVSFENFMDSEERKQFYEFFLSYAFIHEHRNLGEYYVDNDISYEEFPYFERMGVSSIAVKTIEADNGPSCVFVMMSNTVHAFDDKNIVLDNIFGQIEVAARNLTMYYKMQEMSIKDALSGLYNRRYMNLYFQDNFYNAKVDGKISVGMVDIDYFKKINDKYGHLFGDIAIKTVAEQIGECAKAYDGVAFRYGGEEFVIVFRNMDTTQVHFIMEELRRKIKESPIKNDEHCVYANVSMGLSTYPDNTEDLHVLVDRADKAMYYSKQHGRDRLTIDGQYVEE